MKKYYVVGDRVSQSLSPTIFNYWFEKYKIDAVYKYLQLNNQNFDKKIIKTIQDKNTLGFNITIPFKKKIIKHIDILDTHSKKINAVNCVSTKPKIKGINTDWVGYLKALPKKNNLKNKKVLIIGYGGAAAAIYYSLKKEGFKKIIVVNRSKKKIMNSEKTIYTKSIKTLDKHIVNSALIINTTPKNLISPKSKKLVPPNTLLSDIVYKPKTTKFLKQFPKNPKIYGISMLLQQAVPCFKFWFGFSPSVDKKLISILNKKIA